MAYLLLCLLGVDMQEHADAASEASRHSDFTSAEKGDIDPSHLSRLQRRVLRIQIVGDGKECAGNLLQWNIVGCDEPTQQLLCRGTNGLACIGRRGGRATDAPRSHTS